MAKNEVSTVARSWKSDPIEWLRMRSAQLLGHGSLTNRVAKNEVSTVARSRKSDPIGLLRMRSALLLGNYFMPRFRLEECHLDDATIENITWE